MFQKVPQVLHFADCGNQKVYTTSTHQLFQMMLKQYQGELYFVSTLKTTAKETHQQIEESKGKVHLNAKTVFFSINEFASVKVIKRYVSCYSCKGKNIAYSRQKMHRSSVLHCKGVGNIGEFIKTLNVNMKLQFN